MKSCTQIDAVRISAYTSDGWITGLRYGRLVYVKAWIVLNSAANGNFTDYVIATGLPAAIGNTCFIGSVVVDELISNVMAEVNYKGEFIISAKSTSIASRKCSIGGVYITAE